MERLIAKIYILGEYNQTLLIGSTSANEKSNKNFDTICFISHLQYTVKFSKLTNVKQNVIKKSKKSHKYKGSSIDPYIHQDDQSCAIVCLFGDCFGILHDNT